MAENTGALSEESFVIKHVTWRIPNFLDMPRTVGYCKVSREYPFAGATWYFLLYPHGESSNDAGYISLEVVRSHSSVREHRIQHKVAFETPLGRVGEKYSFTGTYDNNNRSWGIRRCLPWSEIIAQKHALESNATMTVFCQIRSKDRATPEASFRPQQNQNEPSQTELQGDSPQTEVFESVAHTEVQEPTSSVEKLQIDYSELLTSEEDSDVCLKVSGKEFRAHKCILKARSKVFSAMFKHDMAEGATGEVVIDDLDPDAFPDFLQHVYAGRVESLSSKNMYSLYSAADKYGLQELKSECRDYMKRTLSVDTFCDIMTLALRYQEEELLKFGSQFFKKNLTKIIVTVRWQTFTKDYNVKANELYIKALVPEKYNES